MLYLNREKHYLLACSFGPDSMALFYLLLKNKLRFDVAIVNYHLRNESNKEVEDLQDFCKTYEIKLHIFDCKKIPKTNIENECRKIRYSFFEELSNKYKYDAILVAHHQDDLLETYLLQKDRKILPKYYGINEETIINGCKIIRPLLSYTKDELLNIVTVNKIPYSIDKTNFDIEIKRNYFRHSIIKNLSNEERKNLLQEIQKANLELETITQKINSIKKDSVEDLKALSSVELCYALNALFNELVEGKNLGFKQCEELSKVIKSKKPNIITRIDSEYNFVKEYNHVSFQKRNKNVFYSYAIKQPTIIDNEYFFMDFTKGAENRNVKDEDYPLTIRTIKKSDEILINGYVVKANRLMIDWKMPLSLRERWPAILSKEGKVIYIPRYQQDFQVSKDLNFYVKF